MRLEVARKCARGACAILAISFLLVFVLLSFVLGVLVVVGAWAGDPACVAGIVSAALLALWWGTWKGFKVLGGQ